MSTIPKPEYGRVVSAASRTVMSVRVGAGTVYFASDDITALLALAEATPPRGLYEVLKQWDIPGAPAISARIECGDRVHRDDITVHGSRDDLRVVQEGINHLYHELRDPGERAALRAMTKQIDSETA